MLGIMERRKFLKYLQLGSISTAALPFANNDLFAYPINRHNLDAKIEKKPLITSDIYLPISQYEILKSVKNKLKLIQRHVGYGNFNIIGFDKAVSIARWGRGIKRFTKEELSFMESIYYYDPSIHGFYGQRTSHNLTEIISKKEVVKIPRTGHYLFKGKTVETYTHMKKDIGNTIVLTSGVRSIVKQMKLYIDKIDKTKGNLSKASKSLAPPAFSYHTIGDFDIGKKGFGYSNFTSRFALTNEFLRMRKLKYIDMRYTINNKDGVRYEPWHIKTI